MARAKDVWIKSYTLIGVCELWGCNPQDVAFIAQQEEELDLLPIGIGEDAHWQHMRTLEFVRAVTDVSEITAIDISDGVDTPAEYVYTCDNCGAHSLKGCEFIKHYKSCKPGEAEYWEKHYGGG